MARVITAVTGVAYPDYVRDRLLRPLGMTSTGYEAGEFAGAGLARGYRRAPGGWSEGPFEPCGAFAPMGGIFSCVADLSHWVFDTPAHCRWWLAGERGVVQVQIQLAPEQPPRVQSLSLAVPPAAGSPLHDILGAVVTWMNGTDREWPAAVPVASRVDAALVARRLRMAAVWAGEGQVSACQAGDGNASVAVELIGARGRLTLALVADPHTRLLHLANVTPEP